jgi:hypothetical protein
MRVFAIALRIIRERGSSYRAFQAYRFMFLRLEPGNIGAMLPAVEKTVRARDPGYPFEVRFFDDD